MANNEILPFAGTDTGTNLLTQAEYNADSQRPIGNQPGVARSKLVNKVLRQTSLIAAAVAQFLADRQANNITDSLTPATLAGYFLNVIGGDIQKSSFNASAAGGTVDAITGTFTPAITALSNGLSVFIRASGANTATIPTFTPNSGTVTAKAIVKGNNLALVAGDIAGAGHWLELQYDSTLDKWVLQNPATGVAAPALPTGSVIYVAQNSAPTGYLKANGAAVSRSTYSQLFAAIGTAFGVGDGSTTFNLPDLRGEFIRGWDDGRGVDSGRVIGTAQTDEFKSHSHDLFETTGDDNSNIGTNTRLRKNTTTAGRTTEFRGGVETRPRNVALLACIKY